jgi:hypothetical protein
MEAQEKETFEQRLEGNNELREELTHLQLIQDGLRLDDLQQKKKMLEDWDDEIEEDKKTNLFGIGWKWSVAATILLIVTAWLIWPQKGPGESDLFVSYFKPLELDISGVRSANKDPDNERSNNFKIATRDYIIESYDKAAPALLKVYEEEKDTLMLLYAGIAFLAEKNTDKALDALDRIDVWPEELKDHVMWYKALLFLDKQENEKAKKEFGELIEKEGDYSDKAKVIMEKLD